MKLRMMITSWYAIFALLFQFSLFAINRMTCISIDSYDKIIKLSQKFSGLQYPYTTTKEELDEDSVNCLSHLSNRNDTFMKCNSQNLCFVSTVLVFESIAGIWNAQQQHGGCWTNSSLESTHCSSSCLFEGRKHGRIQFVTFCLCRGSLCNEKKLLYMRLKNLTDTDCKEYVFATSPAIPVEKNTSRSLIITIAISSATLLFIIACLMVLSCWKQKEKKNTVQIQFTQNLNQEEIQMGGNPPSLSCNTLDDLLHGNLIHLGYHSAIRLGIYGGETIAVKVTPPNCSSQFDNEVDIFRTLGNHLNIAKFITCDQPQYKGRGIILMEYYQSGSLLSFIRHHSLSWKQMLKMVFSIADGLAYLHKKVGSGDDRVKPAIAHRDLNTRNILIKLDGTCVLADFGFALKLVGKPNSRCYIPVGSPRYMAPEVLGRSLILPGWKHALKQVDIYALGLVLWEVSRSCHEVCVSGAELPKCILPYEEELSNGPSMNKVRQYVCDLKMRPKFPDQWDLNIFNLCLLKSLIGECWAHDAGARPDAQNVADRLKQLLDRCGSCPLNTDEVQKEAELSSDVELYFKLRERSNSLTEYMYDDTSEISDSLLLKNGSNEERSSA